jgi:hypothetical protein
VEEKAKKSEEKENSSENGGDKAKVWFQENLRMLVSVAIVVVIAAGIYSYSKRTQPTTDKSDTVATQDSGEGKISVIGGENTGDQSAAKDENEAQPTTNEKAATPETPAVSPQASQETESSFVETAVKGDSTTKLARRALANYLEKNPDSTLTAEHKIYIEDMLRRQVKNGHLGVGESKEFSKDAISKAVEKSKSLSAGQLKNLEKFAKRVPSLK